MSDIESNNETIKTNNIRLKASICNTWLRKGYCPRGLSCIYAHGTDELQDGEIDDNKKQTTVICKYWFNTGWCRNGDSCRFMHPFNEKINENEVKLDDKSDKSANNRNVDSSVHDGKRLQKNYTSLHNLSIPPPSFKTSTGGNNKQKGNENTKNNNNLLNNNNCFLHASRLKNQQIPSLMSENFGSGSFGTRSRRHGTAGSSSLTDEHVGKKKEDANNHKTFDELDEEDNVELASQLALLGKRFNKMENKNSSSNKNQNDGGNSSVINF